MANGNGGDNFGWLNNYFVHSLFESECVDSLDYLLVNCANQCGTCWYCFCQDDSNSQSCSSHFCTDLF